MSTWILLVEDSETDATFVREALEESSAEIELRVIRDGAAAEKLLFSLEEDELPSLVILDLNLPSLRGDQLLARLRSSDNAGCRRLPVVIMSSSRATSDIQKCYDCLANSYIVKPLEINGYFDAIRSIQEYWFQTASIPG